MVYPRSYGWSISEQEIGPTYLEPLSYTDSAILKFPKLQSLLYNTFKILPISISMNIIYLILLFKSNLFAHSLKPRLVLRTIHKNH